MLNSKSPIPLYYQISEIIMKRIKSGEYAMGEKIPSEPSLAEEFGVGRPTIRQAISVLIKKRILESRRGSGTYVCQEEKELDLFSLSGTSHAFQKKGIAVQTTLIKNVALKKIKDDKNNPFNGSKAFCYSRLSSIDSGPLIMEEMFLHPEVFPDFDDNDMTCSLARIVSEIYNLEPISCRQTFRVGKLNDKKAASLGITAADAILIVDRYINFPQIDNAIYSRLYCRTDRFAFSQLITSAYED